MLRSDLSSLRQTQKQLLYRCRRVRSLRAFSCRQLVFIWLCLQRFLRFSRRFLFFFCVFVFYVCFCAAWRAKTTANVNIASAVKYSNAKYKITAKRKAKQSDKILFSCVRFLVLFYFFWLMCKWKRVKNIHLNVRHAARPKSKPKPEPKLTSKQKSKSKVLATYLPSRSHLEHFGISCGQPKLPLLTSIRYATATVEPAQQLINSFKQYTEVSNWSAIGIVLSPIGYALIG